MLIPAEAGLSDEDRAAVARAAAQFNQGFYFDCHETLEDVWRGAREPARDFLQALIQVSVGFHHLERGNRVGALRTFSKALGRFEPYPARYLGFDVAEERARLEGLRLSLEAGGSAAPDPPVWRFDDPPLVAASSDASAETTLTGGRS